MSDGCQTTVYEREDTSNDGSDGESAARERESRVGRREETLSRDPEDMSKDGLDQKIDNDTTPEDRGVGNATEIGDGSTHLAKVNAHAYDGSGWQTRDAERERRYDVRHVASEVGLNDSEKRMAVNVFDDFEDRRQLGERIEGLIFASVRYALMRSRTTVREVEGLGRCEVEIDCRPETGLSIPRFAEPYERMRDGWNVDPDACKRAFRKIVNSR